MISSLSRTKPGHTSAFVFLSVFALIFLVEVVLRYCMPSPESFYSPRHKAFLRKSTELMAKTKSLKLLFVGDSNTYGIGTSSLTMAFPNQLIKLLENKSIQLSWLNGGYPGTDSYDHLQYIGQFSPQGARIILQSGLHNRRTFGFNHLVALCRSQNRSILWNLPFMLKRRLFMRRIEEFIDFGIRKVSREKNLEVIRMNYFSDHLDHLQTQLRTSDHFINLIAFLEISGYLFKKNDHKHIAYQYLAFDLNHLNDAGHFLVSRIIYNWFCTNKFWSLSPEDQEPVYYQDSYLDDVETEILKIKDSILADIEALNREGFERIFHHMYLLMNFGRSQPEIQSILIFTILKCRSEQLRLL